MRAQEAVPKLILLVPALIMLIPISLGHVPVIAENNDNLSTAVYLPDISKSWAIYGRIGEGQAQYYSFYVDKGQRIYASLLIPTDPAVRDFSPSMALLGPGLMAGISLPSYVEVPKTMAL